MSGEKWNATRGQFEQERGNEEKIERPDFLHQQRRRRPADDRAQRPAHADEGKEPLALVGVENVGHEGPEDRDDKKIEDTYPNEEGTADPDLLLRRRKLHQEIEENQVRDEEAVDDGDEAPARESGDERGEKPVGQQHHGHGAGIHPGKVLQATGRADVVADRPQDVIAPEDDEVENESKAQRAQLVRLHVDGALTQS